MITKSNVKVIKVHQDAAACQARCPRPSPRPAAALISCQPRVTAAARLPPP
jgi:hypothetical protein